MLTLFGIVAAGLLLGQLRLGGAALGSSGVIFTALFAGHVGLSVPTGVGTLGLVLFIYGVGLTAGPSFFRAFRQHGKALALLAVILVGSGGAAAWVSSRVLGLPPDLAAGLFAGALTSTPGLATVVEALPADSLAAVGYGISYPFGVVCVVLFVQFLPRLLSLDLNRLDRELQEAESAQRDIRRVAVEVRNPAVFGRRLSDLAFIAESNCQITRVVSGHDLAPLPREFVFEEGQIVLLVGRAFRLDQVAPMLGQVSTREDLSLDTDRHRRRIVATSREILGRSLRELGVLGRFGVTISRFERHEVEFVPDLDDTIQWGDALHAVGEPEALDAFAEYAGHRELAFDYTDLISLSMGIAVGVALGSVSFGFMGQELSLGLVGGPLVVALTAAHYGRIGRINASIPRASRLLLLELGLVLFLAEAGILAGAGLAEVVAEFGPSLLVGSLGVVLTPLIVGTLLGRRLLHLDYLRLIGGTCGGMTSTPGVGAITSAIDSRIPIAAYAAAYPVALVLMTVFARFLVAVL